MATQSRFRSRRSIRRVWPSATTALRRATTCGRSSGNSPGFRAPLRRLVLRGEEIDPPPGRQRVDPPPGRQRVDPPPGRDNEPGGWEGRERAPPREGENPRPRHDLDAPADLERLPGQEQAASCGRQAEIGAQGWSEPVQRERSRPREEPPVLP